MSTGKPPQVVQHPKDGETRAQAAARALMDPTVVAGVLAPHIFEGADADVNVEPAEYIKAIRAQCREVAANDLSSLEAMLVSQANSLSQLFYKLTDRANHALTTGHLDFADKYLRLALKSQSQCRTSIEALAEIKNPRSVAFIKQANVAQNQQVNNGPRAEEIGFAQNEVLEVAHEPMDARGPRQAIGRDPALATVDEIHRPKNRRRKEARQP